MANIASLCCLHSLLYSLFRTYILIHIYTLFYILLYIYIFLYIYDINLQVLFYLFNLVPWLSGRRATEAGGGYALHARVACRVGWCDVDVDLNGMTVVVVQMPFLPCGQRQQDGRGICCGRVISPLSRSILHTFAHCLEAGGITK